MVHLITFELVGTRMPNEPARIGQTIKEMGPSYAFSPATWILQSELSNREICERLYAFVRPTDRVIATRIYRDWIAANIPQAEADWLTGRNFSALGDVPSTSRRIPTIRE